MLATKTSVLASSISPINTEGLDKRFLNRIHWSNRVIWELVEGHGVAEPFGEHKVMTLLEVEQIPNCARETIASKRDCINVKYVRIPFDIERPRQVICDELRYRFMCFVISLGILNDPQDILHSKDPQFVVHTRELTKYWR